MANICTFNHWWWSNLGKWNPIVQSQDNSFEARKMSFFFYLCLRIAPSLNTTGLWHMVNRNIHLFFIPMPFCTFLCFWTFFSFWVLLMPFFLNFFIQAPLSIVSFCVRDVFNFQLTDGKTLLAILYSYGLVLCFDTYWFLRRFFDSYFPFGFQFLAWDHLYIIYCFPCFLSVGLLLSPPRTF